MRDVNSIAFSQLLAADGLPANRVLFVDCRMTSAFMACYFNHRLVWNVLIRLVSRVKIAGPGYFAGSRSLLDNRFPRGDSNVLGVSPRANVRPAAINLPSSTQQLSRRG
jgi:hypothetical protein